MSFVGRGKLLGSSSPLPVPHPLQELSKYGCRFGWNDGFFVYYKKDLAFLSVCIGERTKPPTSKCGSFGRNEIR
jgi:hypothetical protein